MKTVIMLGADLIQGFYTARPSPEVITAIPYEIRAQIRVYKDEREHGRRLKIYQAAHGETVQLDKLTKEGYSRIVIGSDYGDGNITISGTPYLDTDIHIEVAEGFCGSLTLHNAHLSNDAHRPCINFNDKCRCTLIIMGDNRLENSGIKVHEGASLRIEGNGLLEIELGNADYYGIGNDTESHHGALVFSHNALIRVKSTSHSGVCIGSGLGGPITIESGEYELEAHGSNGVCLGSLDGDIEINLTNCDFQAKAAGASSTVIGSLFGNAKIDLSRSSIRIYGYSQVLAAVGSVKGISDVKFENASVSIHSNGKEMTALGSLYNDCSVRIECCTFRAYCDGTNALVVGGLEGRTRFNITNADVGFELTSQLGVCTYAADEDIEVYGKLLVTVDGTQHEGMVNKRAT